MSDEELSDDSWSAESVVCDFLSDPLDRRAALGQLVRSADYANAVAPDAWAVTLFRNLFRLNVGRVEVLVVGRGLIRFNCVGTVGVPPFVGEYFEATSYNSVPGPKCAFVGSPKLFCKIEPELQASYRSFIELAGRRQSGEPVSGSPHRRSHSQDLMAYARSNVLPSASEFVSPDEVSGTALLFEGALRRVIVNAYERNAEARRKCIEEYGASCVICGFNFGMTYGQGMDGYIHVHHLRPLAELNKEYIVNPIEDLRPVCPNCHAVLHSGGSCRSIDEVRELLAKQAFAEPGSTADRDNGDGLPGR